MLDSGLIFDSPAFQGPLSELFRLVKKDNLDILEICLWHFTQQYVEKLHTLNPLEEGGENLLLLSTLLLFKSQKLLPVEVKTDTLEEEVPAPFWNEFTDLLVFKEIATELGELEQKERHFFERGFFPNPDRKPTDLSQVELADLMALFQNILNKQQESPKITLEEEEEMTPKIDELRQLLHQEKSLSFTDLFSLNKGRVTLILFFLALLELMKNQELLLERREGNVYLCLTY
jgi:segregation and condensation protein A